MTIETTNDNEEALKTGAFKMDAGKPGIYQGLIKRFPRALWAVAEISTFGKNKYGTWEGWEGVDDAFNRYMDAKGRHDLKAAMGEEVDPDSQLKHLAHLAWGALATLELYEREKNGTN